VAEAIIDIEEKVAEEAIIKDEEAEVVAVVVVVIVATAQATEVIKDEEALLANKHL